MNEDESFERTVMTCFQLILDFHAWKSTLELKDNQTKLSHIEDYCRIWVKENTTFNRE